MNILILAAHPDDEVLGCGGAIIKHTRDSDKVYICILTDGALTRYKKDMVKTLRQCAMKCSKMLGTSNIIFEKLPNQLLDTLPITRVIHVIEKVIRKVKPDIVYTHDKGDLNRDHRIIHEATLVAARPLPKTRIKKVFTYFVPSSSEYNDTAPKDLFIPNIFLDIKNTIDKKTKANACYHSEKRSYPHPRSPKAIKAYAQRWGIQVGIKYAEPFRLVREIKK